MRVALVVAALVRVAAADISATTHGSTLELTIVNRTAAPIEVPNLMARGVVVYPDLEVIIGKRTLRFIEDDEILRQPATALEPGKSHVVAIDLARYAPRFGNGGPIAPGDYDAAIRWGKLGAATAKVKIPAAVARKCTPAAPGVEIYAERDGDAVAIVVHNAGTDPQCIATSRVALVLDGTRNVPVHLKSQTFELPAGASWSTKQAFRAPAGPHELRARYGALASRGMQVGFH